MLEGLSVNMLPVNQGLGTTVLEPDPAQGFTPKRPIEGGLYPSACSCSQRKKPQVQM